MSFHAAAISRNYLEFPFFHVVQQYGTGLEYGTNNENGGYAFFMSFMVFSYPNKIRYMKPIRKIDRIVKNSRM